MLGYLEYKIQLRKEKKKNREGYLTKFLVKRYILRSKTKEILRLIHNAVDPKSSFDLNTPLTAEYRRRC